PAERPRLLDRQDIVRFLDYANRRAVSSRTHAVQARIGVGDVVTHRALSDLLLRVSNGIGQPQGILGRRPQNVERKSLRGFLSDSGKVLQFVDQALNRHGKIRHARCVTYDAPPRKPALIFPSFHFTSSAPKHLSSRPSERTRARGGTLA